MNTSRQSPCTDPWLPACPLPHRNAIVELENTMSQNRTAPTILSIVLTIAASLGAWGTVEAAGYPSHAVFADVFDDRVKSWDACRSSMQEFLEVRKIIQT